MGTPSARICFRHMRSGSSHSAPSDSAPERARLRILVVDDEWQVRQLMTAYLKEEGHYVISARDGQQALERFKASKWDLVITDSAMPKLSGDELAQAIKKLNIRMPIVLVTGFADSDHKRSPFDLVIRKPFTPETLRAAISRLLG
jgi:CheY-like chemotaxis protein